MKRQLSLLAVALLLAQPVLAKDIPLNRAAALANSVTPAASSQAYDDLEQQALAQLRHALQGDAATLTAIGWRTPNKTKLRPIPPG